MSVEILENTLTWQEKYESLLTSTDKDGNIITATNCGDVVQIYLKLRDSKQKNIGILHCVNGQLFYTKSIFEDKHSMKKFNALGINWNILDKLPDRCIIEYKSKINNYRIFAKEAKEKGEFLYFKNTGYELQKFVNKEFWTKKNNL